MVFMQLSNLFTSCYADSGTVTSKVNLVACRMLDYFRFTCFVGKVYFLRSISCLLDVGQCYC